MKLKKKLKKHLKVLDFNKKTGILQEVVKILYAKINEFGVQRCPFLAQQPEAQWQQAMWFCARQKRSPLVQIQDLVIARIHYRTPKECFG